MMDFKVKFEELLQLLIGYIAGRVSNSELQALLYPRPHYGEDGTDLKY